MDAVESTVSKKIREAGAGQGQPKQPSLIRPKIKIEKNAIEICFLDAKIVIDTYSNELFAGRNGILEKIEYRSVENYYSKKFEKEENIKRPKARVWEAHFERFVAIIDASVSDHRLFFLFFLKEDYNAYRGGAFFKASYYCNAFSKKKQWFVHDLSVPKKEWVFGAVEAIKKPTTLKNWVKR